MGEVRRSKAYTIRPDGFRISGKSTAVHNIAHEHAVVHGTPLAYALEEFMSDVMAHDAEGARVVAHHIEFDGGILKHELERMGMRVRAEQWAGVVKRGLCTMDPCIGQWVLACFGADTQRKEEKRTLRLTDMAKLLVQGKDELKSRAHTAGGDAEMHLLIHYSLANLAATACADRGSSSRMPHDQLSESCAC